MAEILVDLERVTARRPDRPLFESLSLTISTGDRLGVVGVNGTGKSTLLRVLAGVGEPESGTVRRSRGLRVGFLDQQPVLPAGDVRAAVGAARGMGGVPPTAAAGAASDWEAAEILERLGMGGLAEADVATLSGGQAKRVALAQVLVEEVDLLILDEPTNHLDIDAIAWLEARLARFRGGLVLVTHDRHVLDRVTTRMLELDQGRGHVHDGGYASYLEARAERVEREAGAEAVRKNLARTELAWLRRGAPARTRKPKARIASATAIVEGGPGTPAGGSGPIDLVGAGSGAGARPTPTPRLGDKVVTLHGGGHRFGEPWLFRGLDVDLEPGGRLAIVGPNGSGKTTLLDILAGRLTPTEGRVETAGTVVLSYYDQTGRELDPAQRVREAVAGKAAQPGWEQVRLMERFRFDSDLQWATIATLSGGERRRLQLLLALTAFPNVLLLDEPTNDLDLDTLRALEDFLESWPGSLVVVSHDRALMERTAEEAIILDGHGGAAFAPGGYAQYEEARRRRTDPAGTAAGRDSGAARSGGGAATSGGRPGGPGHSSPPRGRSDGPATAGGRDTTPSVGSAAPAHPATGGTKGTPAPKKARSPSTLRRLIGLAEADMEKASAERDGLLADLAAAGNDHMALARIAETLAAAEARLSAAEERWLELSEELGA
ncbi:MAG: transport system ATP-binding/permease protein [Actinomycetota bacterium]|nr:transport system ATP-binding/permease protein [Actinomycetota bacterium]